MNGNPFYTETPANKTFGKGKDSGGHGKGKSNESNPNSNTSNNKGQGGKKEVVENRLVDVDVETDPNPNPNLEKELMASKQEKNWLMNDKDKKSSQVAKKSGTREANVTQPPTLRLSGQTLNPSG